MKTTLCLTALLLTPLTGLAQTTHVVTTLDDFGPGSLRQAIADAASGDTIGFNPALAGETIVLSSELVVDKILTIDASAIAGGMTVDGGSGSTRLFRVAAGGNLSLQNLILTGGNGAGLVASGSGGAIYNAGTLTLTDCTIAGSSAPSGNGGGIQNVGTTVLVRCAILGNTARYVGGGLNSQGTGVSLTASHCTISGNTSQGLGGGGVNLTGSVSTTLTHCTVSGNHAPDTSGTGGGLRRISGTLTLENTLVAGNTAPSNPDLAGSVGTASGVNFIGDPSGATLPGTAGTNYLTGDPMLAPLGDYGGPSQTMPPLAGSPAIDAAGTTDPGGTDQRGFPRFVDGDASSTAALDIGAVEAGPVITVTTATDEDDGVGTGGVSLRDALAEAASNPVPGQRILFDAAVFDGEPADTITLANGQLLIPDTAPEGLVIDASGLPAGVTIDANGATILHRILEIQPGNTVALHGLTLTGGMATTYPNNRGGAIYNDHSTLSLIACTLSGNSADSDGGAIYSNGDSSGSAALSLTACILSGNSADSGGGISSGGSFSGSATLSLSGCTLSGNSASFRGGGIYSNGESSGSATVSLSGCTLSGNSASVRGGGIYSNGEFSGSATLSLSGCTLSGNSTDSEGGGIFSGGFGGSATLSLNGCTLSGNSADSYGGGIYSDGSAGSAMISLDNTVLADNAAPTGPDLREDGTPMEAVTTATGQNLLSSIAGSNILVAPAEITVIADPLLAPLGNYGGPTQTLPPLPGSPAIDAAGTTDPGGTDQRGFPRVVGGAADIGAVEAQAFLKVDTTEDGTPAANLSLREAIAEATAIPGSLIHFDPALFTSAHHTILLTEGQIVIPSPDGVLIYASDLPAGVTLDAQGASRIFDVKAGAEAVLDGLTLRNGLAVDGGAIVNSGNTLIRRCTLTDNQATDEGGAIYTRVGQLTIEDSTLVRNQAAITGGGIFVSSGTFSLSRSTLTENVCGFSGGGLIVLGGLATIAQSTIVGNVAAANPAANSGGGGLYHSSGQAGSLSGSMVANNASAAGSQVQDVSGNLAQSNNLTTGDPLLAPLGWYGGPTQTMPPLVGSPAIDAGGATDPGGTDQRGFTRFVDGDSSGSAALDIGAVEAGPVITVTTASDENDGVGSNDVSLREAIAAATAPGQRILFDPSVFNGELADTITLTEGQLLIPDTAPEGLFIDASGLPAGVTIDANGATTGHRIFEIQPGNTVALHRLTLTGGKVTGGFPDGVGGAIYCDHSTLSLIACTLFSNSADDHGGGIFSSGSNNGSATLSLIASTLSGNSAYRGGGIFSNGFSSGSATLSLTACTLSGNSATYGGGIYSGGLAGSATLSLITCTLSGNSAFNSGGGIFSDGTSDGSATLSLDNTILAGNAAPTGPDLQEDGAGATHDLTGVNLIGDNSGSGIPPVSGLIGIAAAPVDPLLAPLGWYGGPTQTMPPLAGSPAIDTATGSTSTTDQRGAPRPVDGDNDNSVLADIGAVEFQPAIVANTDDMGSGSLRDAIAHPFVSTITFDAAVSGQTVTLTGGQLLIGRSLVIDASNLANGFTIDANGATTGHRIFEITPGNTVALHSLTLRNGRAVGSDPDRYGGAIYNDHSTLSLTSCTVSGNSAYGGGGIYSDGVQGSASLTLSACTLSGNSGTLGGGIFSSGYQGSAFASLDDCTLSDNRASLGGGIGVSGVDGRSELNLTSCTFSENTAYSSGGAIFSTISAGGSSTLSLTSCTVSGNSSRNVGGGIAVNGDHATGTDGTTLNLTDTILAGNNADLAPDLREANSGANTVVMGANLISSIAGSYLTEPLPSGLSLVADPLLAPLGDYGGPTQTMPPLPGSPAIDAAGSTDPGGTDQRGLPRFVNGALDIGAVEIQGANDFLAPLNAAWATNTDGDPNAFGIEFATGTDSGANDPAHANAFRITGMDGSGNPTLTFGLNPTALDYTSWIVKRSTTLLPDSWTEIYRYHGPTRMETATGTTATPMGALLQVVDDNPPPGGAFYLFEAEVASP